MKEVLQKINQMFLSGNYATAENELWNLYSKNKTSFIILKSLGVVLLAQRKYVGSIKVYIEALNIKNDDEEILLNLSYLSNKIQEYYFSIEYGNKLLSLNPNQYKAFLNIAESHLALRNFETALEQMNKGLELAKERIYDHQDYQIAYMDILLALNKKKEAANFAIECLNVKFDDMVLRRLIKLDKSVVPEKFIKIAEDNISQSNFESQNQMLRTHLDSHFSLGNYYEKIDPTKSQYHFNQGNLLLSKLQRHMPLKSQVRAKKLMEFFSENISEFNQYNISSNKGKDCIFIVGMPRSGTTLSESILSTADKSFAGGELMFFGLQLQEIYDGLNFKKMDEKFFIDLGDQYLRQINMEKKNCKYFIDKLPGNFLYLGLIKLALPAAKFLFIRRDPWDNAISLYKELYSSTHQYSTKFFNIAIEYANHEALMDYWLRTFKDDIVEVKYEELVSKTEEISSKIWHFFNLPGSYSPKKRENFYSSTASKYQVTQNIYQTSIKKEEFLEFKDQFNQSLQNQRDFWKKNKIS